MIEQLKKDGDSSYEGVVNVSFFGVTADVYFDEDIDVETANLYVERLENLDSKLLMDLCKYSVFYCKDFYEAVGEGLEFDEEDYEGFNKESFEDIIKYFEYQDSKEDVEGFNEELYEIISDEYFERQDLEEDAEWILGEFKKPTARDNISDFQKLIHTFMILVDEELFESIGIKLKRNDIEEDDIEWILSELKKSIAKNKISDIKELIHNLRVLAMERIDSKDLSMHIVYPLLEKQLYENPLDILKYVGLKSITLEKMEDSDIICYSLDFDCNWEVEHGLQWIFRENTALYVGSYSYIEANNDEVYYNNFDGNYVVGENWY